MQLTSKPITEDIIKIGGRVNKNKGSYFPKIGKKYLPDFIRGLFDGDGSISYCKPRKKGVKGRYYASITSGNKKFITQISKYLYTCGITCKIQEYEPRKFVIRGIEYCGKRKYYILNILMGGRGGYGLIRFADLMYKNAGLKMERKYKKFSCARNLWNKNFGTKK
jgi:intein/homing endonuclease